MQSPNPSVDMGALSQARRRFLLDRGKLTNSRFAFGSHSYRRSHFRMVRHGGTPPPGINSSALCIGQQQPAGLGDRCKGRQHVTLVAAHLDVQQLMRIFQLTPVRLAPTAMRTPQSLCSNCLKTGAF